MNNNDILKRIRYALDLRDSVMVKIFEFADYKITRKELACFFKKEDDEEFVALNDKMLRLFLDGFIIMKRGRKN